MNSVIVNDVTCPVCGGHQFDEEYVPKKLFICATEVGPEMCCGHKIAYCKKCEKLYDQDEFGKHGDVWECKECGTVCWPLTDVMRKHEAALAKLDEMRRKLARLGL